MKPRRGRGMVATPQTLRGRGGRGGLAATGTVDPACRYFRGSGMAVPWLVSSTVDTPSHKMMVRKPTLNPLKLVYCINPQSHNNLSQKSRTWFWLTIMAILAGSLISLAARRKKKTKRLAPGPRGIPILGHLHKLGKNPHHDLHRIAKDHGRIMYMQFGFVPNIIVSSPEAAEHFLKTHDLVFASRPPHQAAKYLSWGQRNLAFGAYGPHWWNMRKLCTLF
ncbi:cytochrome P450 71AU50-like [Salvia splendens]|uniref:cytochrome P450 71AU50-like n=1 Tax=Salvia splendens TaxID=180675 RepID=UPI001C2582B2|nr:cytochrome P450 71AU50-like [Salvia splendens]